MATFRLTRRAEADLLNIPEYTLRTWGEAQTVKYIELLKSSCRRLASRPCPGLRAMTFDPAFIEARQENMFSSIAGMQMTF